MTSISDNPTRSSRLSPTDSPSGVRSRSSCGLSRPHSPNGIESKASALFSNCPRSSVLPSLSLELVLVPLLLPLEPLPCNENKSHKVGTKWTKREASSHLQQQRRHLQRQLSTILSLQPTGPASSLPSLIKTCTTYTNAHSSTEAVRASDHTCSKYKHNTQDAVARAFDHTRPSALAHLRATRAIYLWCNTCAKTTEACVCLTRAFFFFATPCLEACPFCRDARWRRATISLSLNGDSCALLTLSIRAKHRIAKYKLRTNERLLQEQGPHTNTPGDILRSRNERLMPEGAIALGGRMHWLHTSYHSSW